MHGRNDGGAGTAAAIVFYRSHLLAGDIAPIEALAAALAARGLRAAGMYRAEPEGSRTRRVRGRDAARNGVRLWC